MASQISTTGLNPGNYAGAAVPLLDQQSQPDKTSSNAHYEFVENLSRMTRAGQNLGIENKNESNLKKKAAADAERKRKEEEELANKSNAQRLFNLKGGRDLPEKETAWSPAAGNIENLEYANDDLRKEYGVLFAESKINEEQAFINNSSKEYAKKWYQEYLSLDDEDPLKADYTKYASNRAIELKSQRFADNLNGLSEITEAGNRTKLDYSSIESSIAVIQQEHIDRKQAEFLDNYVDTDYQGGGIGQSGLHPRSHGRKEGPPRTPEELFALLNRMQAKVNRGNGLEALYSRDQLHDSVIDNYTQRYLLAKSSEDPIFDAQALFDSATKGMKLTDLQGGIGEKYRKFQKGLYDRFVLLRKAEEKAAEDAEKKLGEDLDTIAYGTVNDISNLHQEAVDNPGTVTAVQIDKLETVLLLHNEQGAFSSQTEEDEFSQAREKISAIRKLIDKTSTTYIPVEKEATTLSKFKKTISTVTTTTELRKLHIDAINKEQNPWLSKNMILEIDAHRKYLEEFADKEATISPEQKKQSNSAMWTALKPIQEAHDACMNEGKCETYNTLSEKDPPKDLLEGDHSDYLKKIGKWNEDQGNAGTNTVKVAAAAAASLINQELGAGKFSLLKARQEFKKLKNPTVGQWGAFDIAVRQHNERVATKDKKVFAEKSLVERSDVFTDVDSVETLAILDTKKGEIRTNPLLTGDDKRFLIKRVNIKRKEIEVKVAKDKDISQSADINQQLLDFTDNEITNETLKGIQAKIDGMTWHGNAGNNLRTFITDLIHKNVSAKKAKEELFKLNEHHSAYQTATNKTETALDVIVKSVKDGNLTPDQAALDIDALEATFNTDNSALLIAGGKIKYKTHHKDLFTKAKKDSGTGDTANKERKKKQKLVEDYRDEVQDLKDYKSDEKLIGISLITKAIKLKTADELIDYKEDNINFSDDSDAKALFVKEINDLIEKREKDILGTSPEEEKRLSGFAKETYIEKIKNSSDITMLNALGPTVRADKVLKGQHGPNVIRFITDRILAIKKTNITNDSLTIANTIDKTLFNVPIINQLALDAAITKAETIKDPDIQRSTVAQLRAIKLRVESRDFNEGEFKKKLALKFKTNSYLSDIKSKILNHVTKAQHANLNFTVETSDKTVKTAITDLENIFTTFKSDQVFLDTMEDSGTSKWSDAFVEGFGELEKLQSKVSKQATAKHNFDVHNESLKSRQADRNAVYKELTALQENYTEDAHNELKLRIEDWGADLINIDGEHEDEYLFKASVQHTLRKAANVAKEKTSKAPKVTNQNTLTTLYTEYADKLSVGGENPQELIKAGKAFLQDEFIAQRVSNSDYKYFENKLNSYNPKAIKTQDGRMRSLETIDSIFRTTHTDPLLSPKLTIPMRGQGSWLEGNQLREELRSKFDAEWQAKAGSFKGDKDESYKWATEYARSLISIDPNVNPLDNKTILRIQTWTGGAIDLGGRKPTDDGKDTGNIKPPKKSETDDLVDQILKRN